MADLAVQATSLTGLAVTYAAASAGGDTFDNDGRTVLLVKNSDTAAHTVTPNSVTPCNYGFDHDVAVSVPAGGGREIGPFDPSRYGVSVSVAYSAVTGMTVAAVRR